MASSNSEVEKKFRLFRVYKDGRIELYHPHWKIIPPFDDPITGVRSKDVIISSDPSVSARIFLPRVTKPNQKFALLFYVHGGAFCSMSAFSPQYHEFCSTVAAKTDVIVVSVEYGLFPTRPIPACYDDSWTALQWVADHANGYGPDPWLNDHAYFGSVFIAGESAGANISHTLAFGVGSIGLPNVKVVGLLMVHPCFGGTVDDHQWLYMCPVHGGLEDPRLKPPPAHLALLGCERVLIFVAEKDHLNSIVRGRITTKN
ncbi:hypothetical protein SLA2020_116720 [Shorea laevis]